MPAIMPNSTVYLLHGVPLDRSYEHTIWWQSAFDQQQWFAGKCAPNAAFGRLSYVRQTEGVIRVEQIADALYDCNYMMFRNTAYGDKWFYAFITKVVYVNDNCTEIQFSIDHMQSWFFEHQLRPCMVEREHATVDTPGSSISAEPVETGPTKCEDIWEPYGNNWDQCVVVAYASLTGQE